MRPPPLHSPAPRSRFPADRQTNWQSGLKVTPSRSTAADWLDLGPRTVGWSPIARLLRLHLPRRPAAVAADAGAGATGGLRTMATAGRCIGPVPMQMHDGPIKKIAQAPQPLHADRMYFPISQYFLLIDSYIELDDSSTEGWRPQCISLDNHWSKIEKSKTIEPNCFHFLHTMEHKTKYENMEKKR
jgi:hypothetical protein